MRRGFVFALLLLGILAVLLAPSRDLHLTLLFDHVKGLEVGDAVYQGGLRIGEVRKLEFAGRRVAVQVTIKSKYRDAVPADSYFFLWRDELKPERRSIRVQSGRSRFSVDGGDSSAPPNTRRQGEGETVRSSQRPKPRR